ncbi:phasin family protein [Myxosarcina sp. GI1]|uniref:phasin family protein n=1 Tax=Myxosarcina sp. GI1 TaxID=1541065 RepID=UPI000562D36A|nr:hypothetical protein [Myxosarcina sp. GI1]
MAGFENIVKKAFYMGVGFASYAQEKAGGTLNDLRIQAQKLADEMAERGEMTAEEARKFVNEIVEQAQKDEVGQGTSTKTENREPRRIEIVDETDTEETTTNNKDELRQQVESLQEELRRLKRNSE